MMIKALLAITVILIAADYALTGGEHLAAWIRAGEHFISWLTDAGRNSIFSK